MKRVYLLYTQDRQDELVARVQKLGVLHLESARLEDEVGRSSEERLLEDRRRVENLLIKARGILDLFAEVDPALLRLRPEEIMTSRADIEELAAAYRKELGTLEGRLKALVSERRELRNRREEIELFREALEASEELLNSAPIAGNELIPVIGESPQGQIVVEVEQALKEQIPGRYALGSKALSEDRLALLVSVDPEYAEPVREYLEAKGLRPLTLPAHVEGDFREGIARLRADETVLPRRLEELESELRVLAEAHAGRLLALTVALENRLTQLEAAVRFGYTRYVLVIAGWLPEDELPRFREALTREFPGILLREDPTTVRLEEVPVALRESRWAKPYQIFLSVFGTPKPGAIDPVPYISVFFPIFFAVIVGDIGYGLVILALALWGLKGFPGLKAPSLKKISRSDMGQSGLKVLLHGGAFSIVLGFVFGEFFGLEFERYGIHLGELWPFNRVERAIDLLIFTIALGAVQVVMGFLFGMITALRHGDRKHLAVKVGLFLSLIAFGLIIGRLMEIVPQGLLIPGLALFAVAVPLLVYGGGATVLLESLSPFVHVLSYARIMGFGIASVVLATLINSLAAQLMGGLGNVVIGALVGTIVAVGLHAFNLALHVFEGTIQSARLHWVEFFEKFILEELGGMPYQPFQEREIVEIQGEP
jgi:V/A-type H+-transporting ATPase subunit I